MRKYLFIAYIILIFISTIGIFLHKEQKFEGTFYLVVPDSVNKTKTISNEMTIEIDGTVAIIQKSGESEHQVIDEENKSLYIKGIKYFYNYNTGHLDLTRKLSDSEFERIQLVSEDSPMFESYKKGTVRYR